ncbi:SEC-C metal-binding domain-containing protein [Altererythrobacter sp. CAU 1778]|uniref:SEC-C metal-binding domain-containing protein n=1 Tax=Croceicoccus gelatinilyticus TaxID=2835536 RepID=UPI001BD17600|nr:SEC-C metal-binding domain-containing protein [Croceicoccus gelatinilyticus]MBS7671495.1 SEC-C domain-containing protein [Croceicoccus gelatinilyticus]
MKSATSRPLAYPRRNDACLCGSGKQFRQCCRDHLPGFAMGEAWREPARNKQWPKVLRAIRADLTQYTIYHRTNTVPLMRRLPPEGIAILSIDIEALHESVEQLTGIYGRLSRLAELPQVFERLRANIDDPRWQRKLTYHQAMVAHLLDDAAGARRELAKLGLITAQEADLDVLQLHIDINGDTIPLVEKLRLYDRVLELTTSRRDRIQYAAAKGVELTLAGDTAGAIAVCDESLNAARESEEERPFGPDTQLWFCKLLEVAGIAKHHRAYFDDASERLRALVELTDHWTPAGLGHVNRCLGDVLRLAGQWEDGAAAYSAGYDLDGDPACRIFEASCRLMQRRAIDALEIIESVDFETLEVPERADYAIAYAAIAIALRDRARLDDAAAKLKAISPVRQYFAHENVRYQLAIERARAAISAGTPVPKSSRLLDWISSMSRWFMVQPNIAGIGLNLNNMVDDAIAARRGKRPTDEEGSE